MEEEEGNMSIPCILAEVAWPSEEELDIKEEHLVLLPFFSSYNCIAVYIALKSVNVHNLLNIPI